MNKVKKLLLELGFSQSEEAEGSRVVLFPSSDNEGRLLTSEDLCSERYAKCRDGLGLFPILVDVTASRTVVQACQIVNQKHQERDDRIKESGLVWYVQAFTDEKEALVFIKCVNKEVTGPLYGPLFPAPSA